MFNYHKVMATGNPVILYQICQSKPYRISRRLVRRFKWKAKIRLNEVINKLWYPFSAEKRSRDEFRKAVEAYLEKHPERRRT